MEQEYIIRLYDADLLMFSQSEHGIEGSKAEIHEINQASQIGPFLAGTAISGSTISWSSC